MFMVADTISQFNTVTLEEMNPVKLMNRTDTKFVTTLPMLEKLLKLAQEDYFVQQIDGRVLLPYYTRYYDTEDYEMYNRHLHGCLTRKKIRVRQYVSSGIEFLEVKKKNNHGRTDKKRISTLNLRKSEIQEFLLAKAAYNVDDLSPKIENSFTRITLVNKDMTERLTLDMDVKFHNIETDISRSLPGIVIIELKRDGRMHSPIYDMLRQLRIKQSGFSKYCIGMAMTNNQLPQNLLKPRLRYINKMMATQ